MASITDLYTREENNEAQKLYIGKEWISVFGCDSDQFIKAKRKAQLDVISGKLEADEVSSVLIAGLIESWSFDEPCTDENKLALIKNSPSLAEQLDRKASERANFTKRLLAASQNTQKATSGSKGQQRKTRKSAGETTTRS